MSLFASVRRSPLGLALAATLLLGACKDDHSGPHEHDVDVHAMRLEVAGQVVTVSDNGTVTPSTPITLPVGASTITAIFLDDDGQPSDDVDAVDFQLNVTVPSGAPVTFTRSTTNPFAGTLQVTGAASNVDLRFALYHLDEQHEDFGPFPVRFTLGG
jgi:hypothetical protein